MNACMTGRGRKESNRIEWRYSEIRFCSVCTSGGVSEWKGDVKMRILTILVNENKVR